MNDDPHSRRPRRLPPPPILALLALALPCVPAAAQNVTWARILAPNNPQPLGRQEAALAYDGATGRTVLFGGYDGSSYLGDTWEFDGYYWHQISPTLLPPPKRRAGMVYDSVRQRVVMYLWENNNPIPTYEYYNSDWHRVITATYPLADYGSCMVYDAARQQVLQFGGQNSQFDNWTYDGVNWNRTTMFPHPPGRAWSAMAYDFARQRVVLFGGQLGGSQLSNDTWEWDGTLWTQRLPLHAPSARRDHAMTYDSARHVCVMYGGHDANNNLLDDTWEWDGTTWTNPHGNYPPARALHAMTFDVGHRTTVMFGAEAGSFFADDTYIYGPITSGSVTPFGQGCPGAAGTPGLQTLAQTVPFVGLPLEVQMTPVGTNPSVDPVLLWLGFSASSFHATPLPLDLGFAGMPGCSLLCGIDAFLPVQNLGNGTTFTVFQMPFIPMLLNATVFCQGAEVDASANAGGLVFSNALQLQIGGIR